MAKGKQQTKAEIEVGTLARSYTKAVISRLGGIVQNSPDEGAAVAAGRVLLERGWGTPKQDKTIEVTGTVGVVLRKMLEDEPDEIESEGDEQ